MLRARLERRLNDERNIARVSRECRDPTDDHTDAPATVYTRMYACTHAGTHACVRSRVPIGNRLRETTRDEEHDWRTSEGTPRATKLPAKLRSRTATDRKASDTTTTRRWTRDQVAAADSARRLRRIPGDRGRSRSQAHCLPREKGTGWRSRRWRCSFCSSKWNKKFRPRARRLRFRHVNSPLVRRGKRARADH